MIEFVLGGSVEAAIMMCTFLCGWQQSLHAVQSSLRAGGEHSEKILMRLLGQLGFKKEQLPLQLVALNALQKKTSQDKSALQNVS